MSGETHVIKQGYGYWDVTSFPYGGDFHRATSAFGVTMVGPGGKYPQRQSIVTCAGLRGPRRLVVKNDGLIPIHADFQQRGAP